MRRVIFNADDFGLAPEVNEAVELSHRHGVLTSASLMVGGPAADDAVRRAKELPSLKVGLHVVLVEGRPVLPPAEVDALVDRNGEFSRNLVGAGFRYFFLPRARRQLEDEIRAQFAAFRQTGLPLDHVNAHNHMHLHPTLLNLILKVGEQYGMRAVRVPYEPLRGRAGSSGLAARVVMIPWLRLLRRRLRRRGLLSNDMVIGLGDTGALDAEAVLRQLNAVPDGLTEFYFHPATARSEALDREMPRYRHADEFRALTDPRVREAIGGSGVRLTTYTDECEAAEQASPKGELRQ